MSGPRSIVSFQCGSELAHLIRVVSAVHLCETLEAETLDELAAIADESTIDLVVHYVSSRDIVHGTSEESRIAAVKELVSPIRKATRADIPILALVPAHFSGKIHELEYLAVIVADPAADLDACEAAVFRLLERERIGRSRSRARSGRSSPAPLAIDSLGGVEDSPE